MGAAHDDAVLVGQPWIVRIVLGKRGAQIKRIGAAARQELEELLDRRIHLFLFVKVRANWAEDPERYAPWALDFNAE